MKLIRGIEWMSVLAFLLVLLALIWVIGDWITEMQGMLMMFAALVFAVLALRSRS